MVFCMQLPINALANIDLTIQKYQANDSQDFFAIPGIKTTEFKNINSQPVGLTGSEVNSKILIFKKGKESRASILFDAKVLVNSYGKKGCLVSTCNIDVKFDDGKVIKYKVYESKHAMYLRKINIKDQNFVARFESANKIQLKIRFADAIDGDFIFLK